MIITDYFASVERSLRKNSSVVQIDEPQAYLVSDDYNGLFHCRVHFWDGSYLDIYEVVSTELGYPVRISYAYTYLRWKTLTFRYDNAPHHPEIITYPHHKHIGPSGHLSPTDQPTLSQVLTEIGTWLEKEK